MATKKKIKPTIESIFDETKPVYIVGGGASLEGFKWDNLQNKQTIVINTAHRKLSSAAAMIFSDKQFYEQWGDVHEKDDFWRFKGRIYSTLKAMKKHPRIEYIDLGLEANTGVKAILLAKMLGAKTVVLLGFDGKAGNWHDGTQLQHRGTTSKEDYARYNKEFEGIASSDIGLTIINANEDSAIDCFEKMPLDKALKLTINLGDL